jgi:hypothetical protein
MHVAESAFVEGVPTPFNTSGNEKCPFCNSDRGGKTIEEHVEEIRRRAETIDS